MPITKSSRPRHLRIVEQRAQIRARSESAYIEREQAHAARVRPFHPAACVDIAHAVNECPDRDRREQLEMRLDALALAVLASALDDGIVSPAVFFAAAGVIAANRRIDEYRDRIESSGLLVAAGLAAAIESVDLPVEVERFLSSLARIDLDVELWGASTIADRIVLAIGDLDSDLIPIGAMHATLLLGTAATVDGYEQRERARRDRSSAADGKVA